MTVTVERDALLPTPPGGVESTLVRLAKAHGACHVLLEERPLKETLGELANALHGILGAELVVLSVATPTGPLLAACPSADGADWSDALHALEGASSTSIAQPNACGPIATPPELARAGITSLFVYPIAHGSLAGAMYLGFREDAAGVPATGLELLAMHLALTLERAISTRDANPPRSGAADERATEELIAMAVHELRTPLTPLTMLLHLLERKTKSSGVADVDTVTRARRQVDRLTQMVTDFFELSRLRRNRLELHPASVELGSALHQAVEHFRQRHGRPRVDFVAPADPIYVLTDESRLAPSLSAFLEHLARVAPSAESLSVGVVVRDGEARLSFRALPPANHPELATAPPPPAEGGRYKSIALHLAEQVIARQGGRVTVEDPRQGAAAVFVGLPLADARISDVQSLESREPPVASSEREK